MKFNREKWKETLRKRKVKEKDLNAMIQLIVELYENKSLGELEIQRDIGLSTHRVKSLLKQYYKILNKGVGNKKLEYVPTDKIAGGDDGAAHIGKKDSFAHKFPAKLIWDKK